jgi:hypothetical protein
VLILVLAATGVSRETDITAGPGCKNVGRGCTRDGQCCSGVCRGRGRRKSCKAHDTGGCPSGEQPGICGGVDVPCVTSTGFNGNCTMTTGRAPYCAATGVCGPCREDADCRAAFGPRAACTVCFRCLDRTFCAGPNPVP